jgi:hypothetical protein
MISQRGTSNNAGCQCQEMVQHTLLPTHTVHSHHTQEARADGAMRWLPGQWKQDRGKGHTTLM